ncbi:MAG TPA: FAD-dependent oxidoreductase [Bacteroidota bacterium]|jgi:sulfide:quinone oxidoreductase|nr:FAD-dependent oxidoreductase [Bacteroidota bacterium]
MKLNVVVLGAGFGGLELTSMLSEVLGESLDLTLIDQHNHFYFGFSKLDVMFGRKPADAVKIPYAGIVKPGVRFKQEVVTGIDPATRSVTTQNGSYKPDVLVVALGANYDIPGTPGLADGGNEYYSFAGAEKLRDILPNFKKGHAVVGVCGAPFKCPPAPSEGALMLHDYLSARGVRRDCTITLVMPFGIPIPPSPDSSRALLASFSQRGITFVPDRVVKALDHARGVVIAKDTKTENTIELPYDLFLGIPKHVAPDVVLKSGLAENGWIPVARENLMTKFPNVYAIGDVTSVGTPKAGVFAEGAGKIAAAAIIADFKSGKPPAPYAGTGSCYIEFGEGKVGRVDVDFFSGPKPVGIHYEPTMELVKDKEHFGSSRKSRWFGK